MRIRPSRTALFMGTLLALVSVARNTSAQQFVPDPNVDFSIVAKHSGMCLGVASAPRRLDRGILVVQSTCSADRGQAWRMTAVETDPGGARYFTIQVASSLMCLDVRGNLSQGNGVVVEQWDCNSRWNQQWKFVSAGGDFFYIVVRHSEKVLDISGGSRDDNAQAHQWEILGGDNQQWKFVRR